jgi:peroxiredoxin
LADDYTRFINAGAEVVAIVNDSVEEAKAYFAKEQLPFPCLSDEGHTVYDRFGVESKGLSLGQRPGLFIIDKDGIVRYAHVGRQQWEIPRDREVLAACAGIPCAVAA